MRKRFPLGVGKNTLAPVKNLYKKKQTINSIVAAKI